MQFELSLVQLTTICAIINGFVFSFLLFEKEENRRANRFLSLLILSMCLTFTPYMLDPSIWHKFRWLAWMPFSISYWIGPSFFFYVRTLTKPSEGFQRKELWHFSPVVLNYIHSFYHAASDGSNPWPKFHHAAEILESAAILSIMTYMIISYRLITSYQQSLLDNVSNTDRIELRWLKQIILVIVISFGLILVFLAVSSGLIGKETFSSWDQYRSGVLLVYAAILYWISISGFRQAQTFNLNVPTHEDQRGLQKEQNKPSAIVNKLKESIFNEKLYRNPELTLSDLARTVGISERGISDAINKNLNKNYYQFINQYRIEEVKERLRDPNYNHLKIFSIAIDAGFNSKASFNRVFKLYTGHTPKEFRSGN